MVRGILALTAGTLLAAVSTQALAGGIERGGYNIDLLFDPSRIATDASVTYVMPERELNNVVDTDTTLPAPLNGLFGVPVGGGGGNLNGRADNVEETEAFVVPRFGFKAGLTDDIDCLAQYGEPWGAHTNPGADWAGANSNIETKIDSFSLEMTCSYKFAVGPGNLRILGGGFYQEIEGFKDRLVISDDVLGAVGIPLSGVGRLELGDEGAGFRVGAAYEIPDIALRASLVYNSEVELDDITGVLDLTGLPLSATNPFAGRVTSVFGEATLPQSVELKLQSGIRPGWLAFGSVKWVDWSVLQSIEFNSTIANNITSLDLFYRDGWTVSGGIGHQFNDKLSGSLALTWDRGTSTGLGSQTDTWTVSGGVAYQPTEMVELRFGGAVGLLTSGSSGQITRDGQVYGDDVSYDFDDDIVSAVSGALKVKF